MDSAKELAEEIKEFMMAYGKRDANEPSEWNSPDGCMMECAALELEARGYVSRLPFSDWGSGGYKPYSSKEGEKLHNDLKVKISKFLKS